MARIVAFGAFVGALLCALGLGALAALRQGLVSFETVAAQVSPVLGADFANSISTTYFGLAGIAIGLAGLLSLIGAPNMAGAGHRFLCWTGIVFGTVTLVVGVAMGIWFVA